VTDRHYTYMCYWIMFYISPNGLPSP